MAEEDSRGDKGEKTVDYVSDKPEENGTDIMKRAVISLNHQSWLETPQTMIMNVIKKRMRMILFLLHE